MNCATAVPLSSLCTAVSVDEVHVATARGLCRAQKRDFNTGVFRHPVLIAPVCIELHLSHHAIILMGLGVGQHASFARLLSLVATAVSQQNVTFYIVETSSALDRHTCAYIYEQPCRGNAHGSRYMYGYTAMEFDHLYSPSTSILNWFQPFNPLPTNNVHMYYGLSISQWRFIWGI